MGCVFVFVDKFLMKRIAAVVCCGSGRKLLTNSAENYLFASDRNGLIDSRRITKTLQYFSSGCVI